MGQVETLNWQWPLGPAPGRDHGRARRTDRHSWAARSMCVWCGGAGLMVAPNLGKAMEFEAGMGR